VNAVSFRSESLRVTRLFLGLFLYSLGMVMNLQANLGYAPWSVFHEGMGLHLGITIGQATILASAVIVAISVFKKESVGFGTLSNVIFVGAFVDIILSWNWIPLTQTLVSGAAMNVAALFVLGAATYLYMGAGYGAGPRDSLMVVITKQTGKPVGLCRGFIEGLVLFTGWLLGGPVGVGTVIYMLGIGAAIQIVFSIMRFDVRTVRQESCYETLVRLGGMGIKLQ
jgi:uncharacterized membrane protein YczE